MPRKCEQLQVPRCKLNKKIVVRYRFSVRQGEKNCSSFSVKVKKREILNQVQNDEFFRSALSGSLVLSVDRFLMRFRVFRDRLRYLHSRNIVLHSVRMGLPSAVLRPPRLRAEVILL